jgi:hypothetical protein
MLLIHRLFIKTALVFLIYGVLAGGWMLLIQSGWNLPESPNLFTVHIHLLGLGFFFMMVCGVALWMFPRRAGESKEEASRDPFGWIAYFLITLGLILRCLALLFTNVFGSPYLAASAFIQAGGVISFVIAIWPRIYLPGANLSHNRK